MATWKKGQARTKPVYTLLSVLVERYEAKAGVSVNYLLEQPQYAYRDIDDEPLFEQMTRLVLAGTVAHPEERKGESFEVTIHCNAQPVEKGRMRLRDMQLLDEYRVPRYREYRGKRAPIYRPVPGFAMLNRTNKESPWTAYLDLAPPLISMFALLGMGRVMYLSVHERRDGRERWIRNFCLQTTNPAEE